MTLETVVAKAQLIINLAEDQGFDEYDEAVVDQFGEYLKGNTSLEKVNTAFDEWLETLTE
jgi:hypothetical protein